MLSNLRVEPPELEPDDVLLAQLSMLSAASVPARREGPARLVVAAVTVLVVACFSWLTGTMPGVASPFHRAEVHRPAPPITPSASAAPAQALEVSPGDEVVTPAPSPRPHHHHGQHLGTSKPSHHDHGQHLGTGGAETDTGTHPNNGHHTGQTKPHQNNGHHTGQTKPHQNNGHHTGQSAPGHGNGHGNGHGHGS